MRHKVYRRINAGSETVVMRYRRRDKGGETEGINREERQREIQMGKYRRSLRLLRDRRRKGEKRDKREETEGKDRGR